MIGTYFESDVNATYLTYMQVSRCISRVECFDCFAVPGGKQLINKFNFLTVILTQWHFGNVTLKVHPPIPTFMS